jgi:hypothetical protein
VFTNHGPVCRLVGYPRVTAFTLDHAPTEQPVRTATP